ncbi:Hypoxic response protein 1 [Anaerohalosphaera lusitana]|uniref:Hypoxic response protein 1 n=1 Tax=Anaerohalosphaera lusitana TaxID=1936003 RepID=A0A1U9NJ75_9BACT|nr:CBS domain-containing protein [Anaerohalosphaera lusitana]AQT67979.1 Hypoxic response protein 1 [Anaerohalosphaera lusitana]
MYVREIMTMGVETIGSDATVAEAAKKMKSLGIGSIPVVQDNKIIGIISGQDVIFRCVAEDRDPRESPVNEFMTSELTCISQDERIEEAAKLMEDKHIHRLLVLDSSNNPVGVLSLSDVAVKSKDEHLAWEVLERISEPASPYRRSEE